MPSSRSDLQRAPGDLAAHVVRIGEATAATSAPSVAERAEAGGRLAPITLATSRKSSTPATRTPSTSAASAARPNGKDQPGDPRPGPPPSAAARAPRHSRTAAERLAHRDRPPASARTSTCSLAARMTIAMARSNSGPPSAWAGARLTVIRCGNSSPELSSAARTPLTRLADRAVGQADQRERGQPGADVDLDR